MTLRYTPDDDIKVHEEGAIRLICSAYQTHEDGLPEWVKNAADEYMRNDAPLEQRVIIIMLHSDSKSFPSSVSVLDFNGMTTTVVEKDFRVWADPEAAQRRRPKGKLDVQGGHGNGGKCYMTMVFDEHALLHTVKAGKGCRRRHRSVWVRARPPVRAGLPGHRPEGGAHDGAVRHRRRLRWVARRCARCIRGERWVHAGHRHQAQGLARAYSYRPGNAGTSRSPTDAGEPRVLPGVRDAQRYRRAKGGTPDAGPDSSRPRVRGRSRHRHSRRADRPEHR